MTLTKKQKKAVHRYVRLFYKEYPNEANSVNLRKIYDALFRSAWGLIANIRAERRWIKAERLSEWKRRHGE